MPQKLLMEQPEAAAGGSAGSCGTSSARTISISNCRITAFLPSSASIPRIIEMSKKTGIPLVCTNDSHYLRQEDSVAHDVLLCIGTGKTVQDSRIACAMKRDQFYFKSAEEMNELWGDIPEALQNTLRIAERCNLEIETYAAASPLSTFRRAYLRHLFREDRSRRLCRNGAPHLEALARDGRLKNPLAGLRRALAFEIEMIKKMKFSSYFLIVWDLIKYARDHAIPVGPGRGSVVGSLVAYSLRITDIDPLQYELFFERFLNPERIAPPDIDMDFCMNRRAEVIEYVAQEIRPRQCLSDHHLRHHGGQGRDSRCRQKPGHSLRRSGSDRQAHSRMNSMPRSTRPSSRNRACARK